MDIACDNTAVRLVSSGIFENSITIAFDLLPDKPTQNSFACPAIKKDSHWSENNKNVLINQPIIFCLNRLLKQTFSFVLIFHALRHSMSL